LVTDRRSNRGEASRFAELSKVPATDGKGRELQLWIVGDGNGFQVLRFTNGFKSLHKDLFEKALEVN
jgi:hypothetical protein